MFSAIRELWDWLTEHRTVLWLATVAAFPQLHYLRHGPRPDLLILPGLGLTVFLVIPWAAAIAHDNWSTAFERERDDTALPRWQGWLAIGLAAVAAAFAFAVAIEWGYAAPRKVMFAAWREDPSFLVQTTALALGSVVVAAGAAAHRPADWGLGAGDWRWWGPLAVGVVAILGISIPLAAWLDPSFIEFYPRHPDARNHGDVWALVQYQLAIGGFMFAWEFFFRGFMLFGFARTIGPFAAILLQAYPFFLLHGRKPETEFVASWFGGIIAGWFAWRSKSCWPTAILHTVMYATMEFTAFGFRFGWPGSS